MLLHVLRYDREGVQCEREGGREGERPQYCSTHYHPDHPFPLCGSRPSRDKGWGGNYQGIMTQASVTTDYHMVVVVGMVVMTLVMTLLVLVVRM